jgi:hypothetical protein
MPPIDVLFEEWYYIVTLAVVMVLSYYARKHDVFQPFYAFIAKYVKSKRTVVLLISAVSGVLPINGRVVVSAGVLNTIAPADARRKKFGVIDYLATHHFYFWSPLEKTVLLPMAALNISYATFMGSIWPLLATIVVYTLFYLFRVVKEEDIEINVRETREVQTLDSKAIFKDNAITVLIISGLLVLGNLVGYYKDFFQAPISAAHDAGLVELVALASFIAAFLLGSSGKFAGVLSLSLPIFGIMYLPMLFAANWAGYILSPVHKCMMIGKRMFGSSFKDYYKVLTIGVVLVFLVSLVATYTYGL